MPPAVTAGTSGFAFTPPLICAVPVSLTSGCAAVSVSTTDVRTPDGGQVALHTPAELRSSLEGGSPLEKDRITSPVFMGFPQSSTIVTSTDAGNAAGTLKVSP